MELSGLHPTSGEGDGGKINKTGFKSKSDPIEDVPPQHRQMFRFTVMNDEFFHVQLSEGGVGARSQFWVICVCLAHDGGIFGVLPLKGSFI